MSSMFDIMKEMYSKIMSSPIPEKVMTPEMLSKMASEGPYSGLIEEYAKKIFDFLKKSATTAATKVVQKKSFWEKFTGFFSNFWNLKKAIDLSLDIA